VKTHRKIDNPATCAVTQRFTYHYWMFAHSPSRTSPSGTDVAMHNHLYNARDKERQFGTASTQYVSTKEFSKWQQVIFVEGNWIDTAKNSHINGCGSLSSWYVHVKGYMRGRYLSYNSIKSTGVANTCTIVTNYRPCGAPPRVQKNGVVDWTDCFMDVNYKYGNTSGVLSTPY
jgi:hypothetical protein